MQPKNVSKSGNKKTSGPATHINKSHPLPLGARRESQYTAAQGARTAQKSPTEDNISKRRLLSGTGEHQEFSLRRQSTNSLNLEPHSLCVAASQPASQRIETQKSIGFNSSENLSHTTFSIFPAPACWKRMQQSVDGTRVENRGPGAPRPPGRRRRTRGLIVSHRGYRWHLFCAPLALTPLLHLGRYIASSERCIMGSWKWFGIGNRRVS